MSDGGKGSSPRPVNKKKWDENFESIFGKRDIMEYHKDKFKKDDRFIHPNKKY